MVNFYFQHRVYFCSYVIRNDVVREIKLTRRKVECSCKDDLFVGIPCRHLVALITKESGLTFDNLKFEERWGLNYFYDEAHDADPSEMPFSDKEDEENEGLQILTVVNF